MTRLRKITFTILLLSLLCASIGFVEAGPFDQTCPNCHGTGTIISESTSTCSNCQGSGKVTTTGVCSTCKGTGENTVTVSCSNCDGDGKVRPSVAKKSQSGYGTLSGLDWVARIEGVFHNEEDEGTYCVVESRVNTVSETYVHSSSRTYLAPHTDVKITIDTPEIGALTDWTYSISIKSLDDITCEQCGGSGGSSTVATCSECKGSGSVTTTATCTFCDGTGTITSGQSITCPTCNGIGNVTNWTSLSIVATVVIILMIASIVTIAVRRRSKQQ